MSDGVFVVQDTSTGNWIAGCCDSRCEDASPGMHTLADIPAKTRAEAAATRHRRYLRTLPTHDDKPRTDACSTCGQSSRAITELQRLVTELEHRLSRHETEAER